MGNECNTCSTGDSCASGSEGKAGDALEQQRQAVKGRMKNVRHKIAIMSGKGGVGKTTVTVNLARALASKGLKVGILDADVTSPNVAKMLDMEEPELRATPAGLFPPEKEGIKVISMAFLAPKDQPIIWRGPMIMGVIEQFLTDIVWGELDYLLVDLPPGTGDEALSIIQFLPEMEGIVTVTTPQEVAILDTRRSVEMARTMQVPVIGLIENMSGFVCPHCDEVTHIFREGGGEKASQELKVPLLGRIPLDPGIADSGDRGDPYVSHGSGAAREALDEVIDNIKKALREQEEKKERELTSMFRERE